MLYSLCLLLREKKRLVALRREKEKLMDEKKVLLDTKLVLLQKDAQG